MQVSWQPGSCAAVTRQSPKALLSRVCRPASQPLLQRTGRDAASLRRAARRMAVAVHAQMDGVEHVLTSAVHGFPSTIDRLAGGLAAALLLADADPSTVADAAAAATDAAAKKGGFFSIFSDTFESFLKVIDSGLAAAGVPYSYGFAIIVITLLVKVATYPLSKKQVESTLSMQALQPRVKELQAKYANDQERLQVETAKLYQSAGVNPLAGCLPTLATIPVFIGLYRALSNVADEGLLTEGFFWIPSLAGPTKLNGGLSWLTLQDGAPPLGWGDTGRYLLLPVLLVVSQFLSQKIISPQQQTTDPSQQQTQAILKFIPLMIGWFSLSVPSGLTLYWFTNNLVTTAQQVWLRRQFDATAAAASGSATGVIDVEGTYVAPKKEEEKRPTGKELSARRSPKQPAAVEVEAEVVGAPTASATAAPAASGSSRGEKFRALKAREAAKKAAAQAGGVKEVAAKHAETAAGGGGVEVKAESAAATTEGESAAAPAAGAVASAQHQGTMQEAEVSPAKDSGGNGDGFVESRGKAAKKGGKKKK